LGREGSMQTHVRRRSDAQPLWPERSRRRLITGKNRRLPLAVWWAGSDYEPAGSCGRGPLSHPIRLGVIAGHQSTVVPEARACIRFCIRVGRAGARPAAGQLKDAALRGGVQEAIGDVSDPVARSEVKSGVDPWRAAARG